jgi:diguanylate cyclase (GGDEF)-like protein/PAS domain S-box-containing protein
MPRSPNTAAGAVANLRAAPEQFLALVELSPDAILIHIDGIITYANAAAVRLLGAQNVAQLIGVEALAIVHPEDRALSRERIARQSRGEAVPRIEQRYVRADGSIVYVEVTSAPFVYGGRTAIQVFARDISARNAADRRILRLTDLYAALSQTSQAITRLRDQRALLNECCRIAVEHGGLSMTWAVQADFERKATSLVAASDPKAAYADEVVISLDRSRPDLHGPVATAILENRSYICNDAATDPNMAPWRALAQRYGLRAAAAFPLRCAGKVWGAIIHHASEPDFFAQDMVALFERMADEISFALDSLESESRRNEAEDALRRQERQIETLLGNLPGMAYRCRHDRDWIMEFVSEGCVELTGYKVEDLLFNNSAAYETIIHAADRARVRAEIDSALAARRRFVVEYRIVCKDGAEKWVWERGQGLNADDGAIIALEGFVTDITERRRAEQNLRQSESRFRSLVELSSDWYWEQDENFRFTHVSGGFFKHSSSGWDNFMGKARWEIEGNLAPPQGWQAHRGALKRHEPFRDLEYGRVLGDGTRRYFSFSGEPIFDDQGHFRGYRGVGRDITARRNAEENLARFRTAMETARDGIFLMDFQTFRYLDVNETGCRMLGYTRDELVGMRTLDTNPHLSEDDQRRRFDEAKARGSDQVIVEPEGRTMRRRDSSVFPVEVARRYVRIGESEVVVGIARDVSERVRAEGDLKLRNLAIESSVNAILITNNRLPGQPIEYVNPAFERITGYAANEVMGLNCRFLQGADRSQLEVATLREAIRNGREAQVVLRNYRKDGGVFWAELSISPLRDTAGEVTHYVGVMSDITEARNYREQLEHQASHDTLTGLPNRSLLNDRLNLAIAHAHRNRNLLAVAFVDLDNFKVINDSLGHGAGDLLLKITAERLRSCLREDDTVARHGGDEFVLLLNDQSGRESATLIMSRVIERLSQPLTVEGHELTNTCSVGVTLYPQDGTDAGVLLRNADAAMYRAKAQGKNSFQFYTADMSSHLGERLKLEAQLRRALERGEFALHYQPKIDLRSGEICGLEALIRWRHPDEGLIAPGRFIGLAEETGLIVPIGDWALRTGCAQVRAWNEEGLPPILLSVNISARQFKRRDLAQTVSRVLGETGLSAPQLELELTESLVMENAEEFIQTLNALKELGISLSVDDFGTGYSSLSYLKRFPVDRLKIDQSFVRGIGTDPDDAAIARAVIQLGHSLDLRVTAEGVETMEQLKFLREHDCDEVQGYLFSHPLSVDKIAELLRNGLRQPALDSI